MEGELFRCRLAPTAPRFFGAFGVALIVSGCGGGSGTSAPAAAAPPAVMSVVTAEDAARLLDQATFGVTPSDVASVQSTGIDAYISAQIALPATQYSGYS